jgi:hypothetical protein
MEQLTIILALAALIMLGVSAVLGHKLLGELSDISAIDEPVINRSSDWDRSVNVNRLEALRGEGRASAKARRRVA